MSKSTPFSQDKIPAPKHLAPLTKSPASLDVPSSTGFNPRVTVIHRLTCPLKFCASETARPFVWNPPHGLLFMKLLLIPQMTEKVHFSCSLSYSWQGFLVVSFSILKWHCPHQSYGNAYCCFTQLSFPFDDFFSVSKTVFSSDSTKRTSMYYLPDQY